MRPFENEVDTAAAVLIDRCRKIGGVVAYQFPDAAILSGIEKAFPISGHFARDHDEAVGLRVGQRPEEDGVHHAVDGGVCANAEAQCKQNRDGEGRAFAEEAQGEAEIVPGGHNHFAMAIRGPLALIAWA